MRARKNAARRDCAALAFALTVRVLAISLSPYCLVPVRAVNDLDESLDETSIRVREKLRESLSQSSSRGEKTEKMIESENGGKSEGSSES